MTDCCAEVWRLPVSEKCQKASTFSFANFCRGAMVALLDKIYQVVPYGPLGRFRPVGREAPERGGLSPVSTPPGLAGPPDSGGVTSTVDPSQCPTDPC